MTAFRSVVFDWAGATIDLGSFAPAAALDAATGCVTIGVALSGS